MQSEQWNQIEPESLKTESTPSENSDAESIVDFEVLSVVSNYGGDSSFLFYLLNLFEKHGYQSLTELKDGMNKKDGGAIHHVAHRFRGSCLNVGAVKLAEVLSRLEEKPITEQTEAQELEEIWNNSEDLFKKSCLQLRQQVPEQNPS